MILDEIVQSKAKTIPQNGRFKALFSDSDKLVLICELKIKSPTHPEPFTDNYSSVLDDYLEANVKAMSVVTEPDYFGGSTDMVSAAKTKGFAVLRKDFVTEPTQIAEVYSDALLLIARIVSPQKLNELTNACISVGIEPVIEVHSKQEIEAAYNTNASIIAVNTRDLDKQQIDFGNGLDLLSQIDSRYTKLLFSGIDSKQQIHQAVQAGADGVLVGTSVLSADDRVAKVKELKGE